MNYRQNNKLIASCGQDVKIYEWPSGRVLYKLSLPNGGNDFFKAIAWSISGNQLLAVPARSQPLVIKRIEDAREYNTDALEEAQISEVGIFSKNVEELVTLGTTNGEIYVVDVFRNNICKTYTTLPSPVIFLDYTPRDTYLAAGCRNGQIYLYNTAGEVCSTFVVPCSQSLSCMMFHPSRESYLAAASKEGVVVIWDIRTNIEKLSLQHNKKPITDISISATEELLATVGLDRYMRIYDLYTKELVFNKIFSTELVAVSSSQAEEEFAVGTSFGRVLFIDSKNPNYIKGSISTQKADIKGLCFCNVLTEEENTKLQEITSKEILGPVESTVSTNGDDSDIKANVSDDYIVQEELFGASRIPGGMDNKSTLDTNNNGKNKNNFEDWVENIPENVGDKEEPCLEMIEEWKLDAIKQEIISLSRENLQRFMEEINARFLKIRMAVSREFCRLEQHNNRRWQEFNVALLKLAGCDETRKESDHNLMSDTMTDVTQETEFSKPESEYAPAKTKITNYTLQKEDN